MVVELMYIINIHPAKNLTIAYQLAVADLLHLFKICITHKRRDMQVNFYRLQFVIITPAYTI
jgi:hypothetical protein